MGSGGDYDLTVQVTKDGEGTSCKIDISGLAGTGIAMPRGGFPTDASGFFHKRIKFSAKRLEICVRVVGTMTDTEETIVLLGPKKPGLKKGFLASWKATGKWLED